MQTEALFRDDARLARARAAVHARTSRDRLGAWHQLMRFHTTTHLLCALVPHPVVRVIDIAGIDLQPCGGTHVANTAEIGAVVETKIENKSAMTRRVVLGFAG
jgi:misacylated tRNA(Ala) deacylase